MSDDEEASVDDEKFPQFSYPELQLYEREEYDEICAKWRMRHLGGEMKDYQCLDKLYRLLRFFHSVKGFFTVASLSKNIILFEPDIF